MSPLGKGETEAGLQGPATVAVSKPPTCNDGETNGSHVDNP